jgi:3-(3-hydroxy-phenyl)propionate hydroxylase
VPDLDLSVAGRPLTVFSLLHAARPVLLNLGRPGALDGVPRPGHVALVDASYGGQWELPVLGPVPAPGAVLIRPDGYVAWTGNGARPGLTEALATWFGDP